MEYRSTEKKNSDEIIDLFKNFNIEYHIKSPTRKNSCIDQIASNIKTGVISEVVHLGLSDHETAQILKINTKTNKTETIVRVIRGNSVNVCHH